MKPTHLIRVALPVPLRQEFDYALPVEDKIERGMRVLVPFGARKLVGIILEKIESTDIPSEKIRFIFQILDEKSLLTDEIFTLCKWIADYYHHPKGEVLEAALPLYLRQGKPAETSTEYYWKLTKTASTVESSTLKKAKKQASILELLARYPDGLSTKTLQKERISASTLKTMQQKGWVDCISQDLFSVEKNNETPLILNAEQQSAFDAITTAKGFNVFLLDGVTGSGKTEVYLQAIEEKLKQKKQVLVLVPEIGLTPQTLQRFRSRFSVPVVALHSGLSEKERLNAWLFAKSGKANIVIGTRSAIFTPFSHLGLIIVDEEHDLSFKQQEGLRYSARDVAVMRAHLNKIPIVLGSATPSLETLHNVKTKRYAHLMLKERAGSAQLPQFHLIDIRKMQLEEGLSQTLLTEMKNHLQAGNQVMLFLNRRGFAPSLMCHHCGWLAQCKRCDVRMTFHQFPKKLHCHHCDSQKPVVKKCPQCNQEPLRAIGLGTERLEEALQKYFPNYSIARIDRDSTQKKGSIETLLENIQNQTHHILIGTQMLAKGHHFPHVTLVGIIDADGGFFSSDFRAMERMGQLLLQVAGRAGRVEKPGHVYIQTCHPEHPLLHQLLQISYQQFAMSLLQERELAFLPPHNFFALFKVEAYDAAHATDFLQKIKTLTASVKEKIGVLGPISAPMPRRAGRHRMQLLLQSSNRPALQQSLSLLLPEIEKIPNKQRVRWALDVDPMEMF